VSTAFADTAYWVALLNADDELHSAAVTAASRYGIRQIVTTDEVLLEVLTFFEGFGPFWRGFVAGEVRAILSNPQVKVVAQSRSSFLAGLDLYEQRPDKHYSGVDCVSMATMRRLHLHQTLTSDHHFQQEGFVALLR